MTNRKSSKRSELGYTLIQMLTTLGLLSILSLIAVSNVKSLRNPLANASFEISHFLRLVRSRAISQTLAITVTATSPTHITTASAASCYDEETTTDQVSNLQLDLPNGAQLSNTEWSVCFSQRGMANEHVIFDLESEGGRTRTIEVALGGGVKVQ